MATTAELRGLFPPEFKPQRRIQIDVRKGPPAGFKMPSFAPFHIEDARPLQALSVSAAEFFDKHGFVLLSHETAVRNWETDPASAEDSEVVRIYYSEIERLIRERLIPAVGWRCINRHRRCGAAAARPRRNMRTAFTAITA